MVWSSTMKKVFGIIKIILFTVLFIFIVLLCGYLDTHYERTGWIQTTKINNEFDFIDSTGHVWRFYDTDLLIPMGKPIEVTVKMHTNHTTNNIKDDIILDYEFKNEK